LEMDQKNKLFYIVDLTTLNAFIIHCSCGGTLSHKLFCEWVVSGLIHAAQDINPTPSTLCHGQTSSQAVCVSRLDFTHSHYWPTKGSSQRCCTVGLCVSTFQTVSHNAALLKMSSEESALFSMALAVNLQTEITQ
jgi:hypothetical protein